MFGTAGVFQHAHQALAVMAVNTDAAAAPDPALRRTRYGRWRRAAARYGITGHDRLARIWSRDPAGDYGGGTAQSQPQDRGWLNNPSVTSCLTSPPGSSFVARYQSRQPRHQRTTTTGATLRWRGIPRRAARG